MSGKKQQCNEKAQRLPIKLVKRDKAYKLALQWVNNMSGSWEDEPTEAQLQGRPPRVGLGAEIFHKTDVRQSNNEAPEWKLRAMLDPRKRKTSINEESMPNPKNTAVSENEEDESESRCNAFTKKRAGPPTTAFPGNKKRRK